MRRDAFASGSCVATGRISCHQRMTQSDLEKNRWPPRSMRLPWWLTVFEIPPTCVSASKSRGRMSERRSSSRAAVSPAGPAPAMTATFLCAGLSDMGVSGHEQDLAAREEVAGERAASRHAVCYQNVQAKPFGSEIDHAGIDREADRADRDEGHAFGTPVAQSILRKHEPHRQAIRDEGAGD